MVGFRKKHGMHGTRVYRIWKGIKTRVKRKEGKDAKYYALKGIGMCSRWKEFSCFLEDMGLPPSDVHSIDRVNPDKGYSMANCRWATSTEQNNNKKNNRRHMYDGKLMTLGEIVRLVGIPYQTVHSRLQRGHSIERAFSPFRTSSQGVFYEGRNWTQADLARANNISPKCLCSRLKAGWEVKEALETAPGQKRGSKC